jgi:hypothetical protein
VAVVIYRRIAGNDIKTVAAPTTAAGPQGTVIYRCKRCLPSPDPYDPARHAVRVGVAPVEIGSPYQQHVHVYMYICIYRNREDRSN